MWAGARWFNVSVSSVYYENNSYTIFYLEGISFGIKTIQMCIDRFLYEMILKFQDFDYSHCSFKSTMNFQESGVYCHYISGCLILQLGTMDGVRPCLLYPKFECYLKIVFI